MQKMPPKIVPSAVPLSAPLSLNDWQTLDNNEAENRSFEIFNATDRYQRERGIRAPRKPFRKTN